MTLRRDSSYQAELRSKPSKYSRICLLCLRRLAVDWTRCRGHGLCSRLVPELVQLDSQGFPVFLDMPVPFWLEQQAVQAVQMCPALALRLEPATPRAAPPALPPGGAPTVRGVLLS